MKRVLFWFGVALATVVVVLLAGFAFLFTPPGERLLAKWVVGKLEAATSEKVSLGRLDFHGDRVVLHQLAASTFGADEALVDVSLSSLFGTVKVDRLALTGYRLQLGRASPRGEAPAPPAPQEKQSGLPSFSIAQIALTGGVISLRTPDQELKVEGVDVTGSVSHRANRWSGALEVKGQVTQPARVPLAISAAASTAGDTQSAKLDASAGETRLQAHVALPFDRRGALRLTGVDGALNLDVPAFTTAGFTYGPLRAAAKLDRGRLQVDALHLVLPGLSAARDETHAGAFTVKLDDLSTTGRSLEALTGRALPDLAGRGALRVRLDDPSTSAALAVDGRLPLLRAGGAEARQLELDGRLAKLSQPLEGQLTAQAESVEVGSRELGGVRVEAQRGALQSRLDASFARPAPTRLQLQLKQKEPGPEEPLSIEQVVLSYPEATWRSEGPALLRFEDDGVVLERLALGASGQRLAVEGASGGAKQHLTATVTQLRLETLPRALLPPQLEPAGVLNAELKLTRPGGQLEGTANLDLARAQLAGVRDVSARLVAKIARDRLEGTVSGRALEGTIDGRFALPVGGTRDAKVSAHVALANASLAGAWPLIAARLSKETADRVKSPAGRLSGTADLSGSAANPELRAQLALDDGAISLEGADRITGLSLRAQAQATRLRVVVPSVVIRAGAGRIQLTGSANRDAPARPFVYQADVDAERFPIPMEQPVLATFKAKLEGTATSEQLTSKVAVTSLRLDHAPKPGAPAASRAAPPPPRPKR